MRTLILMLTILGAGLPVSLARAEDKDPRPDMHAMAAEVLSLEKFLVSDATFGAQANDTAIRGSLTRISEHLAGLGKGAFSDDPSLKANLSLLRQHVTDADRAFRGGNKPFARYMLQSSLQMCIACHTRKKTADFALPEIDATNVAPIDLAELNFATRQFQKGREIYEMLVARYPENAAGQWNVRKALLALAVYYARVKEDPRGGELYFGTVAANEKLPAYLREEAKAWSGEFGAWAKEAPKKNDEKPTEMQLMKQARKLLRDDDFSLVSENGRRFHVRRLRASSLLHRVLESPGERSPSKAQALLYLGQIYPRLSSSLFFRFGDMYLKACITDYPKTSEARSCYVALEQIVAEGYTGSAGTDVPEDEQVELLRLKRLAY